MSSVQTGLVEKVIKMQDKENPENSQRPPSQMSRLFSKRKQSVEITSFNNLRPNTSSNVYSKL